MLRISIYLAMIDSEEGQNKFEQLYVTYQGYLFYRARKILQDDMLAEDAVHLALIQIAENIDIIGEVESEHTKATLLLMVKHRAIDLLRKQNKEQERRGDFLEVEQMAAQEKADGVAESLLDEALERLPWPYQQVILLKYANGYSNEEIASLLQYTVANVNKRVSRGKKMLRQLLKEVQEL